MTPSRSNARRNSYYPGPGRARPAVEGLESRTLLAAVGANAAHDFEPNLVLSESATTASFAGGFTPSQIRKAYGFDQIGLAGGTATADGSGQTIAIVDAYNHPTIAADLAVFNTQFGLPAASLTVVNQTGGARLPATDAGWAGEISLDVEWAHAIAPGANILLVEANSASDADLMAAVDYARRAPGVSVVSMSWGGSEFFTWGNAESNSQLAFDATFTTPSGHQGVTFIASSGDSGTSGGVQWPASSPNVVAVGGTSLQTQDATGTYLSEGPWRGFRNGTSGGFSRVEPEPAYQQEAQQTGARSTPDVGYVADPATGFAVYDSLAYNGSSGWGVVGGTSAGAPQWAALIAIANQGRALTGRGTLDGPTETLPDLYSVYGAPGTADYAAYTSFFNDIGSDGYGYTTGLGTPKADAVVDMLIGQSDSGDDPGTVTPPVKAELPASPLTVAFSTVPVSGVGGESDRVRLKLINASAARFNGPVTVTLYASTDASVSADDTAVTTVTLPRINLRVGGSRSIAIRFTRPTDIADGAYDYIASVNATATNTAPAEAVTPSAVTLAAPAVDLSTVFADAEPISVSAGRPAAVRVTIRNEGNVAASGSATLILYASADETVDDGDTVLATIPVHKVHLHAGKSTTLRVRFTAPAGVAGGSYTLLASTTSTLRQAETNLANDVAAAATA